MNKEKIQKKQVNKADLKKAERKKKLKTILITILINVIISIVFLVIGLHWQNAYTIEAWANASLLSFIFILFIGWIMFIYNKNIISIFTHGFKVFGLMIVGKRPKKSYYEVKVQVEENQIPKRYMVVSFIYSAILLVITIILTILAL